jgi:hypothetical protein
VQAPCPGSSSSEVDVVLEPQEVEVSKADVYGDDREREARKGVSEVGGGLADAALARGHHHPQCGTRRLRDGATAVVAHGDDAVLLEGGGYGRDREAFKRNEDEDNQSRLRGCRGKMVKSH